MIRYEKPSITSSNVAHAFLNKKKEFNLGISIEEPRPGGDGSSFFSAASRESAGRSLAGRESEEGRHRKAVKRSYA